MKRIISLFLCLIMLVGILPASFKAEGASFGDVNSDGNINIMDAYFVRLAAAKLIVPTDRQFYAGDVDGDDRITAIDANLIRKFIINLIERFPVEESVSAFYEIPALARKKISASSVGGIEPYSDHWAFESKIINEDLTGNKELAYTLTVSDETKFVHGEPAGYNKDLLIEWGKDPGLNVSVLHDLGYTGAGAVIAYIDQPIADHEQYADLNLHYVNNSNGDDSMHGPAVLSLLAGKDIGTAPEAEVYFYGHSAWLADQTTHAECLYQIIEQNKKLPEGEKITMVGFSDNIDSSEDNAEAFEEATKAAEDAGIMVWFCADYSSGSFIPMSNKNDPDNVVYDFGRADIVVPTAGRTTSAVMDGSEYIYWSTGGLSWAMPYVLGLYAIAGEIDPDITKEELYNTLCETAETNVNGVNLVNPIGFIAEILRGVGKTTEANELIDEARKRTEYFYAVVNTDEMTEKDISAVDSYLSGFTDAKVIKVDAKNYETAKELYAALKEDSEKRGGTVAGIQLFGNSEVIPAFSIKYKVDMVSAVDDGGFFKTDLFYGNFENEETVFENYNVMDHFANGWNVTVVPEWPVARLPLAKGEFSGFMGKYDAFIEETYSGRLGLVNFSNPIFASSNSSDNMGIFLKRADSEFGILDVDYRLYGNLEGDYPVPYEVMGGFTAENLSAENKKGPAEFIINSHGQWNNVDKCFFVNGQEKRESLINMNTVNTVMDDNYYYFDMWTCLNGYDMKNNITTTALNGNCVGMFSATTIISNNGVDCNAAVAEMAQSNFYWFYYNYLKALDAGESRGRAFFNAQKAYGEALLEDSENPIRPGSNFQFNFYNLFAYHNFGLIENSSLIEKANILYNTDIPEEDDKQEPEVPPQEDEFYVSYDIEHSEDVLKIYNVTRTVDENGNYTITAEFETGKQLYYSCFNPPNGTVFMFTGQTESSGRQTLSFNVTAEQAQEAGDVTVMFYDFNDNVRVRSIAYFRF